MSIRTNTVGQTSTPRRFSARGWWIVAAICLAAISTPLAAGSKPSGVPRIRMIHPRASTWEIGVVVRAQTAPVTGIVATIPVPMNWPEQVVEQIKIDSSPDVRSVRFRELDHGVRQMVVAIPRLAAGVQTQAIITFRITKRDIVAPDKADDLHAPKHPGRRLRKYLLPSPYIDSQDAKIRQIATRITAGQKNDWHKVETIYDWVRTHVEYRFAERIKSARKALDDGYGDCEELSSLIIAMCRDIHVPARLVWVPGHCYPEFYLEDATGKGYWLPCQAAGTRSFGAISEARPILQKGDNFRVPGTRRPQRYVQETLVAKSAPVPPQVQFIRREMNTGKRTIEGQSR